MSKHSDHSPDASSTPYKRTTTNTHDENVSHTIAQLYAELNVKPDDKFTLQKARTLDNITLTDDNLTSPHQVPDYILKTLMIVNYHAREFEVIHKDNNTHNCNFDDNESNDDDAAGINPLDGLLWIFHCADIRLQRVLAIKLSACQLSVPFLLPDPEAPSTNITMLLSALENITKSWKGSYVQQQRECKRSLCDGTSISSSFFHSHWQKYHVEIVLDQ